jgi:hypothetical protein
MRVGIFGVLALALLESGALLSQTTNHKLSGFNFNGKNFQLGMPEREAMAKLSECCKLSPPPKEGADLDPSTHGYYVFAKEGTGFSQSMGGIWFKEQRVVSLSHDLTSNVDTSNDDLVSFMRVLKRSLPQERTGVVVGVHHEQASNAESDLMTFDFPDGRRITIGVVTLDRAGKGSKRDFVSFDESVGTAD